MEPNIFIDDQTIRCRLLEPQELSRPTKETNFPIVIEGTKDISFDFLHDFAKKHKDALKDLLVKHGAILFRGFEVINAEQFKKIIKVFATELAQEYKGTAPRISVANSVFTTSEVADDVILAAHTEMAYSYKRPGIVALYCEVEPSKYGETPIFNCASVCNALSEESLKILEQGVKYVRRHPKKYSKFFGKIGVTWPQSFSTQNKEEIERSIKSSGFDFLWERNEELKIISYPPAIVTHPVTNRKCVNILFNHYLNEFKTLNLFKNRYSLWRRYVMKAIVAMVTLRGKGISLTNLYDHNGKHLPYFLIKELHTLFWNHSVIFSWKKGDVLIIDNIAVGHGRMNVSGPRKILAALGNEYTVDKVN
jgi:alpha-ketoglutarate-dependent taurine dioxygenase